MYSLAPMPMPAGDLDGDGTPDILVQETTSVLPIPVVRGPATLPLSVLSGRTGQTLWTAGPLPLGFEAHGYSQAMWSRPLIVEPGQPPDLLVRHASPFLKASATPLMGSNAMHDRLARISGRTGRILWDVPLVDRFYPANLNNLPPPLVEDLDGDGVADLLFMTQDYRVPKNPPYEIRVHSLHDGRLLWSHTIADGGINPFLTRASAPASRGERSWPRSSRPPWETARP